MAIDTGVPASFKLPLFWATVDGSMAGNLNENGTVLLVGQMLGSAHGPSNAGTATPNVQVPVGSDALAQNMFGAGSILERMVQAFLNNNTTNELWALPVLDGVGTAATGTIDLSGTITGSGVLSLYIAGQLVSVGVASTDTPDSVAANTVTAINAFPELPVTAALTTSGGPNVTLTSKNKGGICNDITLQLNYLGVYGGEATPTGLVVTMPAQLTGGTGEPNFTAAISAIQTQEFDYVAMPYTDTGSMTAWNTEYGFGPTGRWNYTRQQYGFIVNFYRGDYADLLEWGLAQNSPVMSTIGMEQQVPSPVWEASAAYCASAALGFSDDPARPLQTLELLGILPASLQNRFTTQQRAALVNSGIATQYVNPSGNMAIEREQLQYQFNVYGQSDTAFALLTTPSTLQALLQRMKSSITTKYPRVKLFPDGTALGPGQAAVTPTIIAGELVSEYSSAMYDGLVSNMAAFKAGLLVEINDQNPNRLDVLWDPTLAEQLRQMTVLAQFRLLAAIPAG
jgi:phage tail sheath gpL-like